MTKIFYDYLIKIEEVISELDKYELTIEERDEFIAIVDETFHCQVLETILASLPSQRHEIFLSMFYKKPHKKNLIDFLKKECSLEIEDKIRQEAARVKKEILDDIKKLKTKR